MKEHYRGLGHVGIYTKDIESHIAYYEKIGGRLTDRALIVTPQGNRVLAMVDFAGIMIELIQPPTEFHLGEGAIPHIAIYVDDVDQTGKDLQALGVNTFRTEAPISRADVFGGVRNWFFEGPSGEVIELLKTL